jgi:hypothetical protein
LQRLLSSSSVSVPLWSSVCVIPTTTYMATLRLLHLAPYSRYGISLGLAHHRGLSFHRELGFLCVCFSPPFLVGLRNCVIICIYNACCMYLGVQLWGIT